MDLLLKNAAILTMDSRDTLYDDGYILIEGNTIQEIGPTNALHLAEDSTSLRVIDCSGKIVMPGMINTHCHMSMVVFRSLGDDVPDRLRRYLFPLEKDTMHRDMAVAGARYAVAEMLMGGVTTVYDAYYFEDAIAHAVEKTGIRGVLSETVINFPSPSAVEPYGGIALTKELIAKWKGHPRITSAVNCHALYTNSGEHLHKCHQIAREAGVIFCMHVAEMDFEQQECLEKYGLTPTAYLDSIGVLDSKFLAAHAINVNEQDIEILSKRGVKVSYNAGSNAKSAKGVAPVAEMRRKGITVGLGTDGPMSGNTIDILTQLPLVAKIQKLFCNDRSLMPAKEILRMATIDGAKALGLEDITGSIEPGKRADLIILETDSLNMGPIYDYASTIVYGANPSNVVTTIVDGEILMENRGLTGIDIASVKKDIVQYREEIFSAAQKLDEQENSR